MRFIGALPCAMICRALSAQFAVRLYFALGSWEIYRVIDICRALDFSAHGILFVYPALAHGKVPAHARDRFSGSVSSSLSFSQFFRYCMLDYLWRIPELPNSDMLLLVLVHDIYSCVKSLQCYLMFRTPTKKLRPENNTSIPESMILTSCCAGPETTQEKQPCGYF
jgi:hypothetical protein